MLYKEKRADETGNVTLTAGITYDILYPKIFYTQDKWFPVSLGLKPIDQGWESLMPNRNEAYRQVL